MAGFFTWGDNGEQVTPDEIDQRRQLAQSLMQQSQQPANYWTQGVANMMNAFLGGFENGRANKEQRQNEDYNKSLVQGLVGGSQGAQQQPIAQTQSPAPASDPLTAALTNPQTGVSSPASQNAASGMIADDYLNHLAQAESGGKLDAKAIASSALGPYQFTDGTWRGMMRQHPDLGLTADGRTDPAQAKAAAQAFTADNIAYMLAHGVQNPTAGQEYLAHFAGAPTASKLIQADPATPVSALMSSGQINANPFLRGMTAGDVQNWANNRIGISGASSQQAAQPSVQQPVQTQGVPAVAMPQQAGPDMSQLLAAMSDPRANQQTRGIASALLQNRMQQDYEARQRQDGQQQWLQRQDYSNTQDQKNWQERQQYLTQQQASDPLRQAQIAEANARTQSLLHPTQQPRSFQTVTGAQAQSLNLDPNQTWQVGADGSTKSLGKSPEAAAQAQRATQANTASAIDSVDTAANNALALLKGHPGSTTGTLGHYAASWLPGSNAAQLRDQINTIKSNGSYAALSALKAQGVSMGSMSDADMRLASEKAGAINPDAPPDVVRQQINDYRATVNRLYQGSSGASNAPPAQQAATSTGTQPQYRAGQSSAATRTGRTATNPQTGARLYEYSNGQWRPN